MRIDAPLSVAAVVLALGVAVQPVHAQNPDVPTVAVLDFTGLMLGSAGNSAPLGKAVSSMLITELIGNPGLQVIERYQLQDLLMEQRLALSGRVDEGTAVEIGKMVGAQYMIYGQVTSIAEQLRMDMRVVDVETSEVVEAQKMNDKTSELLSVVVRMADSFVEKLDLDPPSSRAKMEPIPVRATVEFPVPSISRTRVRSSRPWSITGRHSRSTSPPRCSTGGRSTGGERRGRPMTKALRGAVAWTPALTLACMALIPDGLGAQQDAEIAFDTDLPRVLVFIQEEDGQIAAREMTNFLLEGGFPVVDPALAYTAARGSWCRRRWVGTRVPLRAWVVTSGRRC